MSEPDLAAFDVALQEVLREDAARTVAPPVAVVVGRARSRRRRRIGLAAAGAAAGVLLLAPALPDLRGGGPAPERLASPPARLVLAAGTDPEGPWQLVWTPDDRCLTHVRATGEGGYCDLADPPDLQETTVRAVGDPAAPETLVAGLVPPGTARVAVTPSAGQQVVVDVVRSGPATLFVARLAGLTGVERIEARDGQGQVVAAYDGPALPPPVPPGPPQQAAPGARRQVEVPWAVDAVSADRRTVTVVAHAAAGGCTRPGSTFLVEDPDGLRLVVQVDVPVSPDPCPPAEPLRLDVELPRPLAAGEQVLGQCVPDDATAPGQTCRTLRSGPSG